MDVELLTPAEMAQRCDISIDTLRYYEREGLLLEAVTRTEGGQRRYQADYVGWINVLRCLRTTALPIRELRRFAELVRQGDEGIASRVDLLVEHRAAVVTQMAALDEALEMIDHKIDAYTEHLNITPPVDLADNATALTLGGKGVRATR